MSRSVTHTWFFFGDSLTLGVNDSSFPGGWVSRLFKMGGDAGLYEYPPATFYNLGARRQNTAAVAARWRTEVNARDMPGIVRRVVFCVGVVDMAGPAGSEPGAVAASAAVFERMVSEARLFAPILAVSPPPVANSEVTARLAALSEAQSKICDRLGVAYSNIHPALAALPDYMDDLSDGIHPGPRGNAVTAELLFCNELMRDFLRPDPE